MTRKNRTADDADERRGLGRRRPQIARKRFWISVRESQKLAENVMELLYKDLTEKIIKALFEVHKNIGPGLTEVIYRRALVYELGLMGLKVEAEKEVVIFYKGKKLGTYRMDLVVEDKVILELKIVSSLEPIHEAQILSYLKTTEYKVGLLVNFGKKELEFKRFIHQDLKR